MTIREMRRRMDSRELSLWRRYYNEEPWGHEMENLRSGTIATQVCAPWCKSYRLPKPGDWFKLRRDGKKASSAYVQPESEMKATMERAKKRFDAYRERQRKCREGG